MTTIRWNELDESTQNQLKGAGKILSVVVPGGLIKQTLNKTPKNTGLGKTPTPQTPTHVDNPKNAGNDGGKTDSSGKGSNVETDETLLINPPITQTSKGLQHIIERHTDSGINKFSGKSKFNKEEDISALIQSGTQQPMIQQTNGNFARTFDIGRNIGFDRITKKSTSIMTVITKPNGDLVTAFPGKP